MDRNGCTAHRGRRALGAGLLLALAMTDGQAGAAEERVPPRAGCLDTRTVTEARLVAPREVLVRTQAGQGRLHLLTDCPAAGDDGVGTVAPDGWACAAGGAWVRSGDALCPVVAWQPMDEGEFRAATAGDADADMPSLERVEVNAARPASRGFGGTTETCLDSRFVRGWHQDAEGLVVEVAPIRHAGNRYYRVETATSCPDAQLADSVRLVSATGGAAICGRAGDRALLTKGRSTEMEAGPLGHGLAAASGCAVSRVYPLRD